MTTHKLIGSDYQYPYFCTSGGDIYYVDDVAERIYPEFGLVSRTVDERHHGKLTRYVSVPLLHKDGGRTPAADAGEMIARSVLKIGLGIPGFIRLKDGNMHNIHMANLEFVQVGRYTGEVIAVWDTDGRTPVDDKLEAVKKEDEQFYSKHLAQGHGKPIPGKRTPTNSVKMDLGDRDRSVVAELLYSLITEKEMSAADALKVLCIPGGYDTLELFLEGKDIVEERVVRDMEEQYKRDQERVDNHPLVRAQRELREKHGYPGTPPEGPQPSIDRRV